MEASAGSEERKIVRPRIRECNGEGVGRKFCENGRMSGEGRPQQTREGYCFCREGDNAGSDRSSRIHGECADDDLRGTVGGAVCGGAGVVSRSARQDES